MKRYSEDSEVFYPAKQPMRRDKPFREGGDAPKKYKDDKRRHREAIARKRGE